MSPFKKNILIIISISLGLILIYLFLLFLLKCNFFDLKPNEFGDYVGGILNPLFTLLSTAAIIILSYIIAKNESSKANESIVAQKRITLNQMRQNALDNLTNKLNLFAYELEKIPIHNVKIGSLIQSVLTQNLEKSKDEPSILWFIIYNEIDSFSQSKYLFQNLFDSSEFDDTYNSLLEITRNLNKELGSTRMITINTLEKYIETKQKLVTQIGNFILTEF